MGYFMHVGFGRSTSTPPLLRGFQYTWVIPPFNKGKLPNVDFFACRVSIYFISNPFHLRSKTHLIVMNLIFSLT